MRYGIVIDSGSSGSRLQIYQWDASSKSGSSVPEILHVKKGSMKVSPGVSSFADKPQKVWKSHYKSLLKYAEKIIPEGSWAETPVFVYSTAGMRLLPKSKQSAILKETCKGIDQKTPFSIQDCSSQVSVIDGEIEGVYGWLSLNYMLGQFFNYKQEMDPAERSSYGFMDMGGASTQVSFVPSNGAEIEKHKDDLHTIYLRNVDGSPQEWDLFVSTWLGFGANEARRRFLESLVVSLPSSSQNIVDPCSPVGSSFIFQYKKENYRFTGSGNYEQCLKTMYPLLLKHLPCSDSPCLFNGVHAPAIDFQKNKFVGVSEYWYTANDIFQMGGEYNFMTFNERVKEFCESDWEDLEKDLKEGKYGTNMKMEYLKDSCFKASWVVNVLHEGFGLPRIGLETDLSETQLDQIDDEAKHKPFQSMNTIKDVEISWTLGAMLLFVSSQIEVPSSKQGSAQVVGIKPSDRWIEQGRGFIAGSVKDSLLEQPHSDFYGIRIFLFVVLVGLIVFAMRRKRLEMTILKEKARGFVHRVLSVPKDLEVSQEELEEGRQWDRKHEEGSASTLRTRSSIHLADLSGGLFRHENNSMPDLGSPRVNFFNNYSKYLKSEDEEKAEKVV